ncbi:Aste57867_1476 [Aphanomyces stellatus]|uniref:Aste57867_1476 protein n=1 Tax=Aphanomyces stellatus TaxID=120398 RepID=A0A485K7X5_9STRA|nr:hypothetical protein As57867_001475 [Aphanomyces stellatus]VFT78692.1 Aste57867_1476 [Aphanomyces stellatus]
MAPKAPKTFDHQPSLPHLPVPELDDTLDKYLTSIQPFVTPAEYETTKAKVESFRRGQGPKLQALLQQRAADEPNWLAEWWEYAAYTSYRAPIAVDINMISGFGAFNELTSPVPQARRAAEIIRYTSEYHARLVAEAIPPETMGRRVMCMDMYNRIFSACRIPASPADTYERYHGHKDIHHVAVLCRGHAFALDVRDPAGALLSIGDLERQLKYIQQFAGHFTAEGKVGILTAAQRDIWTDARECLIESNAASFQSIQEALFVVCLDDDKPTTNSELLQLAAAGAPHNRWYDKSLQFIVWANGNIGANLEHGNADATVYRVVFEWLGKRYLTRNGGLETRIESTSEAFLPPPTYFPFHVPPSVAATIDKVKATHDQRAALFQAVVVRYKAGGRDACKSVLKIAPDTFVQLAVQWAAYSIWKKVRPTYESAHTRWFLHGRTETIRSVANETKAWLEAVFSNKPREASYDLFEKAVAKHQELAMTALQGHGIDRHLLGLQVASVVSGEELPPLYSDPAYAKAGGNGNFVLSTSNVSGYEWLWGGFAPMLPHGIGVCYGIEPGHIGCLVSSNKQAPGQPKDDRVDCHVFGKHLLDGFRQLTEYIQEKNSKL